MSALGLLAVLASVAVSSSQTSDCSYVGLLNHLNLTTTNELLAMMRPVKNWTTSTLVEMDMVVYGILEVDEKSQTVTSHVWFQMHWTDEFLNWNPPDFCGIEGLTVPRSKLWIPNISIKEDASDAGSIERSPQVSLFASGFVFANARQRLTFTCQLDLFLFPFDRQSCNITFLSMNAEIDTVTLATINNDTTLMKVSELFMITHGEWQLEQMETNIQTINKDDASQGTLIYTVTIIRKPMLYVINLIVPLFYLLVLDLASFFISEARGEKLSFKVTILLSISVLLLILQDMLPSTEDNLPMIASYCVAIFALVGLSVLEAMLVSFLIDLDGYCGKKAQSSVDAQVDFQLEADCHKASCWGQKQHYESEPAGAEEKDQVTPARTYLPLVEPSGRDLLKGILEEVKAARQEADRQDKNRRTETGFYKRLAEIVDSVFFVLYFLTFVIFLSCMYSVWLQNYI
ncbi:5-hydroxytryptamine receptor 3A-like [Enoplosus armatus]|uniref:5-hydroxytryptamine receptor 3A-like n=1 Tax=Enoplosus armatus TaxID=215367 RepID=UPI0039957D99